jgi:hypothetical protein
MTRRPYRPNVWHSALDELKGATVFEEERLSKSTAQLGSTHPFWRCELVSSNGELIPHENDRPVYEVVGDTVWMLALALVHTSRRWPPLHE